MALLLAIESKSVTKLRWGARAIQLTALLTIAFLMGSASAVEMHTLSGRPEFLVRNGGLAVSANLPQGRVGAAYSGKISVTGGLAPYKYTFVDGRLPQGLSLELGSGTVSGTPTIAGTSRGWIQVTDARRVSAFLQVSLVISSSPNTPSVSISITPTTTSLASGASKAFSATVQGTSNTAVTWSASAGSITTSGNFVAPRVTTATTVTVRATSTADSSKSASAIVNVAPVVTTVSISVSPSSATVTAGKGQQFAATVLGTSNTGVTWSASVGTISNAGLFTAPSVSSNTSVTITATSLADATKRASANITVNPASAPPTNSLAITTSSVPGVQSGTSYVYLFGANGGTLPYSWSVASGSLPSGFSFGSNGQLSGNTAQTGQFTFTAQVTDAANNSTSRSFSFSVTAPPTPGTPSGTYDGPAELPRTYMQTSLANTPAPGTVIAVGAGGNFQAALNSVNCGDTITLAAGATFSGLFTLPAKACDDQHWIIIRTSAPDTSLPPEGTRMQPCYAGVSSLPGRPAFSCNGTQNVLATISDPQVNSTGPILFASGANHYRLLGLKITRTAGTGINYEFVSVPTGTADHIILDRVWLAGTPQDENKNAINMSGMTYAALIDSYSSDFHCISGVGACTDAKVVGGGNSTLPGGPYKITNNFIEASTEGILFGGGPATTTPADIEIRHNHFYKPMMWMKGQPNFVGGPAGNPFMVKNLLELKNAQRVLIEGNIFENTWGGYSQAGYALLLTPKNQASGCPICEVTDVTIRYNTFSHSGAGISMANVPDDNGAIGYAGERYSIHDVTLDDINATFYAATPGSSSGTLFQVMNGWPNSALNSISINHVTGFGDPHSKIISLGNNPNYPQMYGFTLTNSILGQSLYPVWSTGGTSNCANPDVPLPSMNACFTNYTFNHNAIIATTYAATKWPGGNSFPISANAVQFTSFNNAIGGIYQLLSSSPFLSAGSDGKDLGADMSAIQAAIAGVY